MAAAFEGGGGSGESSDARLLAMEVLLGQVSEQVKQLSRDVQPILLANSGWIERLARLQTDIDHSHQRHRDIDLWRTNLEGRLAKADLDLAKRLDSFDATLSQVSLFIASQVTSNQKYDGQLVEWERWKNKLFGGVLVVQAVIGAVILFKDQILRALGAGGG